MRFSKLVEHVSKRPLPPHVKHLIVEVMVSDKEGEDVEVWLCYSWTTHFSSVQIRLGAIHRRWNLMGCHTKAVLYSRKYKDHVVRADTCDE